MESKTRKKIEAVLDEAHELTEGGQDEYAAARAALTAQTTDVLRELAVAAIVDVVRRRRRAASLAAEKSAEKPREMHERAGRGTANAGAISPKEAGVRVDSKAYWRWVEDTPEGAAYQREREEWERRRVGGMVRLIADFAEKLHIEWTAELLGADFALSDGSRVTWGEATIEQHQERAVMFQRNAVQNAEGAARHLKAIEDLQSSGAPTLAELVGVDTTTYEGTWSK